MAKLIELCSQNLICHLYTRKSKSPDKETIKLILKHTVLTKRPVHDGKPPGSFGRKSNTGSDVYSKVMKLKLRWLPTLEF